jgi:predicted metalloprotease with PDZ domain
LLKVLRPAVVGGLLLVLGAVCSIGVTRAEETKPIFELDCVSFAGRFLANAPVKKKAYPGLAVDGTAWAISPETKKVEITKVFPGEAAEKDGVEVGDQVVSVNGYMTDGLQLRELFGAYHMYQPDTLTETLIVQKKDGTQKTVKLQLLTTDKCNAEEKTAWLEKYKGWGY